MFADTNGFDLTTSWTNANSIEYNGGQSQTKLPSKEYKPLPSAKFKPPNNIWTESVEMPNPYFDILNHRNNPQSMWKAINVTSFLFCIHFMSKIVSCEFNPGINVSRFSYSTLAHWSRYRAQFFRMAADSSSSRAYASFPGRSSGRASEVLFKAANLIGTTMLGIHIPINCFKIKVNSIFFHDHRLFKARRT